MGTWKMERSEGFNEVMERLGVSLLVRKTANASHPRIEFSQKDEVFTMKTLSTFKTTEVSFQLGVTFDEKTIDGRNVKSTITMDASTMKQVQEGEGKTTFTTRSIEDGKLTNVRLYPFVLINAFLLVTNRGCSSISDYQCG